MALTGKTRIPSTPNLEYRIAEMGQIVNPAKYEIVLLAQYKKMLEQLNNTNEILEYFKTHVESLVVRSVKTFTY